MFKNHLVIYENVSKENPTKDRKDSKDKEKEYTTTTTIINDTFIKSGDFSKSQDDVLGTLNITVPFSKENLSKWAPLKRNVKIVGGVFDSENLFHGRTNEINQNGVELEVTLEDPGWKLKEDYDGADYDADIHEVLTTIIKKARLKPIINDIPDEKINRTDIWASNTGGEAGKGCVGGPGKCSCGKFLAGSGVSNHYWKNYCPICGKSGTLKYTGLNDNTDPCGGKAGNVIVEGHIWCCPSCADYCVTCGWDHRDRAGPHRLIPCSADVQTSSDKTSTDTSSDTTSTDTTKKTESTAADSTGTVPTGETETPETHTYEEELRKICDSRDYQIIVNQNEECIIRPSQLPKKPDYAIEKWMMEKDSFEYNFKMPTGDYVIATEATVTYDKGTSTVRIQELYDIYGSKTPIKMSLPKMHKEEAELEAKRALYAVLRETSSEMSFNMLTTGKIHPGMWIEVFNPKLGIKEVVWVNSIDMQLDITTPFTTEVTCKYMPENPELEDLAGGKTGNLGSLEAIGKEEAKFRDCQIGHCGIPGNDPSYPWSNEKWGASDCWGDSFWLYDKFYAAGIPCRILGSGKHRWVEIDMGQGWIEFPGYIETGRKWGGYHHGSGGKRGTLIVGPNDPNSHPGL
jgi:hypothetical protein